MGGSPEVDDPTIADDAELWRRIHPKWVVADENQDRWRVSSAAFDDSPDGSPLSVLLASIVAQTGRSGHQILERFEGYVLASVAAKVPRSRGQIIVRTPDVDEPAHASVIGPKTQSNRRAMAKAAKWIVPPPHSVSE